MDPRPTVSPPRHTAPAVSELAFEVAPETVVDSTEPPTTVSKLATTAPAGRSDTTTTTATTTTVVDAGLAPATTAAGDPFGYPASPDGTPLPIVVIYDTDTISIAGQVPSQAAKDRLAALAVGNSQFPEAVLVDTMVVNEAVPLSVGVRVIELNSARFPEGGADIVPEHAVQLDRVVNIMKALPNISVVVVGHADQRGDDVANFAISDERARAVVNYLLYLGVEPTRLSSRAAGETDLLSLGDDDVSLALNRRTEFIFYGLLVE